MAALIPAPIGRAETLAARSAFVDSPTNEALELFIDELQVSSDMEVDGDLRELWFNYHLTMAFIDSQRWEDAAEAAYDALMVAVNLRSREWEDLFAEMQREIEKLVWSK